MKTVMNNREFVEYTKNCMKGIYLKDNNELIEDIKDLILSGYKYNREPIEVNTAIVDILLKS